MPQPRSEAELTWDQVHAFRLARHHLLDAVPSGHLLRAVSDSGGLQAQVMSATELQACVRASIPVTDVRDALWKSRTLVKTWLMRGTLHIVPAADLPLYTAATQTRSSRLRQSWLEYWGLTAAELEDVVEGIADAMDGVPKTREEILSRVGAGRSQRLRESLASGWGGLLKPVARRGLLCFGPSRGPNVTFVRPEAWLGRWREVDPGKALVEVARRYLRAFGPATKADFARWWGVWPGAGAFAWDGLRSELAQVSVEGARADVLAGDVAAITSMRPTDSTVLLPAFDPYLMGHAGRAHLVAGQHAKKVSRVAGWISPVVLVGGRAVATWTHALRSGALHVKVSSFERLPRSAHAPIRRRVEVIAAALGATAGEVDFA